ncbi:hypothetical protein Tco_0761191 [Tanacetum coccineum]
MEDEFYHFDCEAMISRHIREDTKNCQTYVSHYVPDSKKKMEVSSRDCLEVLKECYRPKPETSRGSQLTSPEANGSGGPSDQELQKQRTSHSKQSATSIGNFPCLWRERALCKSVPKDHQQHCLGKSPTSKEIGNA